MKLIPMLAMAGAMLMATTTTQAQTAGATNRSGPQLDAHVQEFWRHQGAQSTSAVVATSAVNTTSGTSALSGVYVGANVGNTFRDATEWQAGVVVGYQFRTNWAVEATYDFNRMDQGVNGQNVMANLVYSRPWGTTGVTPYVLAGAGVGWNASGERGSGDNLALYNVGGGVRVNVYRGLDLDARYRYVGAFEEDSRGNTHMLTLGAIYKF
jgi:opacity protein-like surface antigen